MFFVIIILAYSKQYKKNDPKARVQEEDSKDEIIYIDDE